eukprot:TRINITY_DN821_c0_g2_i4.p1 TRINITY_DN821_c0_g2~~TRINITY_DN821_c0_g2_i4.p1  ORF type:complete len:216 (+),score=96.46 TRINITY_DN821_c0_g2_i4:77-724(+)
MAASTTKVSPISLSKSSIVKGIDQLVSKGHDSFLAREYLNNITKRRKQRVRSNLVETCFKRTDNAIGLCVSRKIWSKFNKMGEPCYWLITNFVPTQSGDFQRGLVYGSFVWRGKIETRKRPLRIHCAYKRDWEVIDPTELKKLPKEELPDELADLKEEFLKEGLLIEGITTEKLKETIENFKLENIELDSDLNSLIEQVSRLRLKSSPIESTTLQ